MKVTARPQTDQNIQTQPLHNGKNTHSLSVEKKNKHDCQASLEKYHSDFTHEYLFGDRQKAFGLLPFIDPNYDNGYFLLIAAEEVDSNMIEELLERGAKVGIQEALAAATCNRDDKGCIELLIEKGKANPLLLSGTTAAFHPRIKAYLAEASNS